MRIEPEDKELWSRFRACERNEMIITKSGRCLFPVLKLRIAEGDEGDYQREKGDEDEEFVSETNLISYALSMERIDQYKWKYRDGHWYHQPSNNSMLQFRGSSGVDSDFHIYEPESSPTTWNQIQQEGFNFSKVKLTNRKGSHSTNNNTSNFGIGVISHRPQSISNHQYSNFFSLCSFGNYVPIVYLCNWGKFLERHGAPITVPVKLSVLFQRFSLDDLLKEGTVEKIKVEECSFIAVTHYQNSLITHLKKHNNPHAKGFILSDEGIGRVRNYMSRGRPGRKRHSPPMVKESLTEPPELPYDVILASLALEKMSSGSIPRTEIVTLSPGSDDIIIPKTIKWSTFEKDNKKAEKSDNFWGYYRK